LLRYSRGTFSTYSLRVNAIFFNVINAKETGYYRLRVFIVDERSKRRRCARKKFTTSPNLFRFQLPAPSRNSIRDLANERMSKREDKRGNANCDTNVRSRRNILHVNGRDGVQG